MNVCFIVKNGAQIKSGIMISVSVSVKIQNNIVCAKKLLYLESCESIIADLVIICDEIMKEAKAIPTKSISTKAILTQCTSTNFCILAAFLLINIPLLIAVSIYCCFIKHQAKQKPLLPYHYTISKLKVTRY